MRSPLTPARDRAATQPHARAGTIGEARSPTCLGRATSLLGAVVAVAFLLPALLAIAAVAYIQSTGRIAPGVTVGEQALQGLTMAQAAADLDRAWNREHAFTLIDTSAPSRTWAAHPSEFGLQVDAGASALQAQAVGRGRGLLGGLSEMVDSLRSGREIPPVILFDPAVARAGLEAWAARVGIPPVEATFEIQGGAVVQAPGQSGKALDVEATLAILESDPASALLTYDFVALVMTPVPPRIRDVSAAAADAESLLGAQLALTAYDPVTGETFAWSPSREEIASWLSVERGDSQLTVSVNPDRVAGYVAGLNAELGSERGLAADLAQASLLAGLEEEAPSPLVIHYQPRTYVVGASDTLVSIGFQVGLPYWTILEANPQVVGRALIAGETLVIPPRDAMLALPVVVDKRIVISISQQHMWAYQGGSLVSEHPVSTGISRSPTLPGIFQVQTHIPNAYAAIWDLYMPDFLGIYEAVPGFWNGIHGLPLLHGGVRLWADVLGRPASYGCIILDLQASADLYNWAEDGVVVEIQP
jgi:lipoprotein-anchoring transpeptidase ErfK/SrfK